MVPHSICPDTHSATSSAHLDSLLCAKLREYSLLIRSASSASAARLLKSKFLAEVYNVCAVTLGVPPRADETFTWEYNDKDGKFCSWTGTPKEFYEQYGKRKGMDMRDSVALVHDARNETGVVWEMDKYGSGNVWGEKSIRCKCYICLCFTPEKLPTWSVQAVKPFVDVQTSTLPSRPSNRPRSPVSAPTPPCTSNATSAVPHTPLPA